MTCSLSAENRKRGEKAGKAIFPGKTFEKKKRNGNKFLIRIYNIRKQNSTALDNGNHANRTNYLAQVIAHHRSYFCFSFPSSNRSGVTSLSPSTSEKENVNKQVSDRNRSSQEFART